MQRILETRDVSESRKVGAIITRTRKKKKETTRKLFCYRDEKYFMKNFVKSFLFAKKRSAAAKKKKTADISFVENEERQTREYTSTTTRYNIDEENPGEEINEVSISRDRDDTTEWKDVCGEN